MARTAQHDWGVRIVTGADGSHEVWAWAKDGSPDGEAQVLEWTFTDYEDARAHAAWLRSQLASLGGRR